MTIKKAVRKLNAKIFEDSRFAAPENRREDAKRALSIDKAAKEASWRGLARTKAFLMHIKLC